MDSNLRRNLLGSENWPFQLLSLSGPFYHFEGVYYQNWKPQTGGISLVKSFYFYGFVSNNL